MVVITAAVLSIRSMLARPDASTWRARQVVLISIDTLRADRLGAYGYTAKETSPNLDRPRQAVGGLRSRLFGGTVDDSLARRRAHRALSRSRSAPTPMPTR
ncbi:MAG: hypothetical protein U0802_01485 [Candidatus Binatia bacterium]